MGCAGLSLAYRLSTEEFSNKKILILDKSQKDINDRTWSFWMKENHLFDTIVYKKWNKINFYGDSTLEALSIAPYQYQMIRGIDFYNHVKHTIEKNPRIEIKYVDVLDINEDKDSCTVTTSDGSYSGSYVFNSIVKRQPVNKHLFVWQHFKGWVIKTKEHTFDSDTATFMDFRIDQDDETRFVYVLPISETEALIEATIFSKEICDASIYDDILKSYCRDYLNIDKYDILDEELGAIPMTTEKFDSQSDVNRIIPIGTLNGTVKPSSGYAFVRIQEEAEKLIHSIRENRIGRIPKKTKYLWYDRTLLDVIISNRQSAKSVFSMMFERNKPQEIFHFLNEKSTLLQEVKIFMTLPFFPFLKAFIITNVLSLTKK